LIALEAQASRIGGPRSWVHHDVRSDNLLFRAADTPMLIDYPYLAFGLSSMDVVSSCLASRARAGRRP
jgi:aminoglycoside phosphotransferase (APT) family kinase protein